MNELSDNVKNNEGCSNSLETVASHSGGLRTNFTEREENCIWFAAQWLFKKENKDRIIKRAEFFKYLYYELE